MQMEAEATLKRSRIQNRNIYSGWVGGFYYTAETRDSTTAVWLLLAIIVHKLHIYEGGHMCGR